MPMRVGTPENSDVSWNAVAVNYLGILLITYITHPVKSEMAGPDAIWYLLIKVGTVGFFATVAVGFVSLFRRWRGTGRRRRSFVVASWLFLGLIVLGSMSNTTTPAAQQAARLRQCAQGQAVGPEGQCLTPYAGEYTPSPPPEGFAVDPPQQAPAIVDPWAQAPQLDANGCPEHYVLVPERGNLCYPVVHLSSQQAIDFNARQQAKQDMQDAIEGAIRATR